MRGDGSLYLRGKIWWIRFYRDGVPYTLSAKTTVKEEAKAKLRALTADARSDEFIPPKQRRVKIEELFSDLVRHYRVECSAPHRAEDADRRWRLHLKESFGHIRAEALTTQHLRDYRARRLETGAAQATINRELTLLRRAYRLAAEAEPPKVKRVPRFGLPAVDNARKVFVPQDAIPRLKQAAAHEGLWQRVLLEMAFTYGWRRGELFGLRVQNIRLADNCVRLEDSKNGDAREVPIPPSLRVLLEALVLGRPAEDRLFPVTADGFRHAWRRICERAGLKAGEKDGITFHDLRRTSTRTKMSAGVPLPVIMDIQGWRTTGMLKRYAITDHQNKLDAFAREAAAQPMGEA